MYRPVFVHLLKDMARCVMPRQEYLAFRAYADGWPIRDLAQSFPRSWERVKAGIRLVQTRDERWRNEVEVAMAITGGPLDRGHPLLKSFQGDLKTVQSTID